MINLIISIFVVMLVITLAFSWENILNDSLNLEIQSLDSKHLISLDVYK